MKAKSVKTRVCQLIKQIGRKKLAQDLDIDLSYIYKLEKGFIPGRRLYRDICKLEN